MGKWWKKAFGYQIYIRSFKDSNHDGIGDIRGIIEKLDYLSYLGINLIWICPFFESPMDDNGYDVSDFYNVSGDYGDMSDIKELIAKAHQKKIKIITISIINSAEFLPKYALIENIFSTVFPTSIFDVISFSEVFRKGNSFDKFCINIFISSKVLINVC